MTRPNLEGLFTGATPADPPLSWLNGKAAEPEPPSAPSPAPSATPPATPAPSTGRPAGLLDPVALAERYFTMMQALLDLQRDIGMRVAQQVAALAPLDRFRR